MNIASKTAQATADLFPRTLKAFTDKRSVWLIGAIQGGWSLVAALFASGDAATFALWINAGFGLVTYMQVKAREWLELAGTDMPPDVSDTGQDSGT